MLLKIDLVGQVDMLNYQKHAVNDNQRSWLSC